MSIKVGIIGFTHGHILSICDEWQKKKELGIEVAAGWDHDATQLQDAVQKFGLQPYTNLDDLLSRSDIPAVVITTETSLHAEMVERAAAAGKSIILYKPMALTMAEADRIVKAVKENNVPFTMGWQMRVDPQNLKMKELLDSGDFGKVFYVRRRHGLRMGLNPDFANSWHVDPVKNRDIWADDSSHPIDFVQWLFGVPESVTAEIVTLHNPAIPMNNGIAIFRYPNNGPLVEVCCSFTCMAAENTVEIVCEKGTIIQNYGDSTSCNVPRPEGLPGLKWYHADTKQWTYSDIPTPSEHGLRIRENASVFADFLYGRRGPTATVEEARDSLKMVLATYVSTREGRRVDFDDPQIHLV
jgi:predicted dehydrogenase